MTEPRVEAGDRAEGEMAVNDLLAKLDREHARIEASFPELFKALGFHHWHHRDNLDMWMIRDAVNNLAKAYARQNEIRVLQNTIRHERDREVPSEAS
jgi:hypothetical protein